MPLPVQQRPKDVLPHLMWTSGDLRYFRAIAALRTYTPTDSSTPLSWKLTKYLLHGLIRLHPECHPDLAQKFPPEQIYDSLERLHAGIFNLERQQLDYVKQYPEMFQALVDEAWERFAVDKQPTSEGGPVSAGVKGEQVIRGGHGNGNSSGGGSGGSYRGSYVGNYGSSSKHSDRSGRH